MKFITILSFYSICLINTIQSMELADEPESSISHLYHKPTSLPALEWIQQLEKIRDLADTHSNFEKFKRATNEISATIGGKYGISERVATKEEEIIIVHSIIRTRHKFIEQRYMISDRYLNYNLQYSYELLQKDSLLNTHIAAVLAIDCLAVKALKDEDFQEAWNQINLKDGVSSQFIENLVKEAKVSEKNKIFKVLNQSLHNFFHTQPATIYLSNEIFNLFAPKLTLEKIYADVMVSGGTYKGWQVHNIDAFAYPLNLTESERELNPGLEKKLRERFLRDLPKFTEEIFPTSQKATSPTNELRAKLNLNSQEGLIEYIYDNCLIHRTGYGIYGEGPRRFYLSRLIPSSLYSLTLSFSNVIPSPTILKAYQYIILKSEGRQTSEMYNTMLRWGIPYGGDSLAYTFGVDDDGKEIERNIDELREQANLGNKNASLSLAGSLYWYAKKLFDGSANFKRDIPKAIQIMKEAYTLGYENSARDLLFFLNKYCFMLFHGKEEVKIDIVKAIKLAKKLSKFGDKESDKKIAELLNSYGIRLFEGADGTERNIPQSFEILKEAAILGNKAAKTNYAVFHNRYAFMLSEGKEGIEKDLDRAIEFFKKAILLGNESARNNLNSMITNHALKLLKNKDIAEEDFNKGAKLLKKTANLADKAVKNNIAIILNNHALTLFDGKDGIEKQPFRAIKLLRKANSLGNESAKNNLAACLNDYALKMINASDRSEKDYFEAIDLMQEAVTLGSERAKKNLDVFLNQYSLNFFQHL